MKRKKKISKSQVVQGDNMGKVDDAVKFWDECKRNGMVSNVYTYGVMINFYQKLAHYNHYHRERKIEGK
jgi:hypothetical protein